MTMLRTNLKFKGIYLGLFLFSLSLFNAYNLYAANVTLSWIPPSTRADGTPLTDLAAYKIYFGTSSGNYTQNIDVGNVTIYTVTNLSTGTAYYFATTAYDASNNESSFSNEVSKTIAAVVTYYCDKDNDGYKSTTIDGTCSGTGCGPIGCQTTPGNDCNDNDQTINPVVTEGPYGNAKCTDGKDNDCDGLIDAGDPGCQQSNVDLIVSALTGPTTGVPGSTISVTATTKNNGPGNAPASTTKFYWSTNTTWEIGDTYLGSRSVPLLTAGASSVGSASVTIPAVATAGTRYIIAKADANSAVAETIETNNNKSKSIDIGPDLIVSLITAPTSAVRGSTISISATTKNNGGGGAGASTTKLYLSTNTSWEAGDTYLGSRSVSLLTAGASSVGSTSVTIPAVATAGTLYIIAKADANSAVAETIETNNNKTKAITINP